MASIRLNHLGVEVEDVAGPGDVRFAERALGGAEPRDFLDHGSPPIRGRILRGEVVQGV